MVAILQSASDHSKRRHDTGRGETSQRAAANMKLRKLLTTNILAEAAEQIQTHMPPAPMRRPYHSVAKRGDTCAGCGRVEHFGLGAGYWRQ
jgi:hypothetical protein